MVWIWLIGMFCLTQIFVKLILNIQEIILNLKIAFSASLKKRRNCDNTETHGNNQLGLSSSGHLYMRHVLCTCMYMYMWLNLSPSHHSQLSYLWLTKSAWFGWTHTLELVGQPCFKSKFHLPCLVNPRIANHF